MLLSEKGSWDYSPTKIIKSLLFALNFQLLINIIIRLVTGHKMACPSSNYKEVPF